MCSSSSDPFVRLGLPTHIRDISLSRIASRRLSVTLNRRRSLACRKSSGRSFSTIGATLDRAPPETSRRGCNDCSAESVGSVERGWFEANSRQEPMQEVDDAVMRQRRGAKLDRELPRSSGPRTEATVSVAFVQAPFLNFEGHSMRRTADLTMESRRI